MARFNFLSNRPRLGAALMLLAVWSPLLALAMPIWIYARNTQSESTAAPHSHEAGESSQYKTTNLEWVDAARSRRVPVRLFWPAAAQDGPVPLVVFSPGIGSSRDGYTYLGRYWAEHGIASLHLQHVGSDRSLWQGNPFALVNRFESATSETEAIARVQDARFALDRLLASRLAPHIAMNHISAAGHSYGANTTMLQIGASVMRNGRVLEVRDSRISSAILISAPPFYGESNLQSILGSIKIPTLHITTEDDVIRIPGFGSGLADREEIFEATGSARKVLAVYGEGSHNVFTDRRYFDSKQVATDVQTDTRELSLAFLDQVNEGSGSLSSWTDQHPGLIARFVVVMRD